MVKGYFRLEVNHITRDTKNIVASASYRSDEELYSERTDENIKFKNHAVKPESMILTPENAPDWAKDRETLWNEVDKVEKENSKTQSPRLATEILLSLPNDLDREVQTELTKDYVQTEFVDKGMVADISIHRDDENNPHAHVLLTTRPFDENQSWGKKVQTKTQYDENGNPLLNKNGNKIRKQIRFNDINTNEIRENWKEKLNYYSEREQSLKRYDNRSFEKQGLNKIAEIPLTREEYRLEQSEKRKCEKEGKSYEPVTYYGQKNEQIRAYNRGEVSQLFTDEEQEKAQNEINSFVALANNEVQENEESYNVIKERYKHDVGYIEAKETMKNTFDIASTFGRKTQNDLLKNDIEQQYLIYISEKFEQDSDYRNSVLSSGITTDEFDKNMQNDFKQLLENETKLKQKDDKRENIYQSAKDIYNTEIKRNNYIVQQMYPTNHNQFNDDEKAFIVNEALKGKFIKATEVQQTFKNNGNIPENVYAEDIYKKISKDIFFSQQKINNTDSDSKEHFIENTFVNEKLKELNNYSEYIDDDLLLKVGTKNFEKVKDQSPYEKAQLMIKLDKYNNVPTDDIINKHNNDSQNERNEQTKNYNNKNERHNNSNVNVSDFLMHYANHIEQENQSQPKKRKKKKKQNNTKGQQLY